MMLTVRSGREVVVLAVTWSVAVAELVKVVLDLVPVAVAVLFRVVPAEAVTLPWMVTVQDAPPASDLPEPIEQVTLPALCEQLPGEALRIRPVILWT